MNVSSGFINENLAIGKKVLDNFNKNFSGVESRSMVKLQFIKETNPQIKENLAVKLKKLDLRLGALKKDVYEKSYESYGEYLNTLKGAGKKYNILDCDHRTDLIRGALNSQGITSKKIEMGIFDSNGRQVGNHIFPVTAMKQNANANIIETWGENAVIVDAWANFVMKAEDGVNCLLNMIGFNPQKVNVKFSIRA